MIVVGLTGSIGMGKTTVAHMLQEMGIPVHDADAAVHRLLGPGGSAVGPVGMRFPSTRARDVNGATIIDRQALGRIVFAGRRDKRDLEGILHPMVRAESDKFVRNMRREGHDLVVLDIPLLFETGGEKRVNVTICVSAPPETQKARVMQRDGMTSEKFDRIVAGQLPDAEKRRRADYVIENGGDFDSTRTQLAHILNLIKTAAGVN